MEYKFLIIDPKSGGRFSNPNFPWIATGLTVSYGQQITIMAQGLIHLYPPELEVSMPWVGPDGCEIGDCHLVSADLLAPSIGGAKLIGRFDDYIFEVGSYLNVNGVAEMVGELFLTINDYQFNDYFYYRDNRGYFLVLIAIGADSCNMEGICLEGFQCNPITSSNPIKLRNGAKVVEETDLRLNSPAEALTFTRYFNQEQRDDSHYQFMGMGWSHNHRYQLQFTGTTPSQVAEIYMPSGAILYLDEDQTSSGERFYSRAGAIAELTYSSANGGEYTLTMLNKKTFVFSSTTPYLLKRRAWPNNEVWTYEFDGNNLERVSDGYGRELIFDYYSEQTGDDAFKNGQLCRVGDQTNGESLGDAVPEGTYVEFDYATEKVDGDPVGSPPRALLATVQDARGFEWGYDYYGQHSGEPMSSVLNCLTKRLSPEADTDGDNDVDESITLEELVYETDISGFTLNKIIQKRGSDSLETEFEFQPWADKTLEKVPGQTLTHYFTNGVYLASMRPDKNFQWQAIDDNYRMAGMGDTGTNNTALMWSSDGKHLEAVTNALAQDTTFNYDDETDLLNYSLDAEDRKTAYTYDDDDVPRQPTLVEVFDSDEVKVRHQEFTYDDKGRTLTETLIDPVDEVTILQQVSRIYYDSGDGNGLLETVTQEGGSQSISTTYYYDSAGRIVKTQQGTEFGNCKISYTVYDKAGNVVASICNYDPGLEPDPTTAEDAIALYNELEPEKNKVTTHEYDALGRRVKTTVNAGASFSQTTLTFYDGLSRVWRTITNYVDDDYEAPGLWIWEDDVWKDSPSGTAISHGANDSENIIVDTQYNERGLVRLHRDTLGNVTLYGYDENGRLIKTVQNVSQADYDNSYDVSGDPQLADYPSPYSLSDDPDEDIITEQHYDASGNVIWTKNPLGVITFTDYDALNRPIKVVRNLNDLEAINLYDNDPRYYAGSPRSGNYIANTSPDVDLIDTTDYDAMGRVYRTGRLLENRGAESEWDYTLNGYDALGRQVQVIRNASDPDYDVEEHPDLSGYEVSDDPDQDIITETFYDAAGKVTHTHDYPETFDPSGRRKTQYFYDALGRQIKTIINSTYESGTPTPDNDAYVGNLSDPAADIITQTYYDDDGRVQRTKSVLRTNSGETDLEWRWTLYGYDELGRQIKVISNASDPDYDIEADRDLSDYDPVSDSDQDIISRTGYDAQGRVQSTFDTHGNETRSVYDITGRRLLTIVNYVAQGSSDPADWVWDTQWEDGDNNAISFGDDKDQNQITANRYDLVGRVTSTRDSAGIETRYEYDKSGRQVKTIVNYVNDVYDPGSPDEDLISTTAYNKAGQIIETTDARGTKTTFTYDDAGRQLTVTQAAETNLATTRYTCYDKAGRVRRVIDGYIPLYNDEDELISPDVLTDGIWAFQPSQHGTENDRNRISESTYNRAGRVITTTDPMGNTATTTYFKDGQIQSVTDPEGMVTQYRYDKLRRRQTVVQGYEPQPNSLTPVDPQEWLWSDGNNQWEYSTGNAIAHGAAEDQNIIVQVTYDKSGRTLALRNPLGFETLYAYDLLDRRTSLTNPLDHEWVTAYTNQVDGTTRVTMTYPNDPTHQVQRDMDRLGRPMTIQYLNESPKLTPDVTFAYDEAGNRARMTESGGTNRETIYSYDKVHRLTSIDFDTDGDNDVDETVSYAYDAGGLRTELKLPGDLTITYLYDTKGQLVSLTDWDDQNTRFGYDLAGRHLITERANGLRSRYRYDAAGRLRTLRHTAGRQALAQFDYQVDRRGNRTQAREFLRHPGDSADTTIAFDDPGIIYIGSWTNSSPFKVAAGFSERMAVLVAGSEVSFTYGVGSDHSIFDVYIGGTLWQSYDGYAASAGEVTQTFELSGDGPYLFEVRNRAEKHPSSSGYKMRFKQIVLSNITYDLRTIDYTYDRISRLVEADYNNGAEIVTYGFDLAGNLTNLDGTLRTYNAANQLIHDGTNSLTYDSNGNLWKTNDVETHVWDRANRLLSFGGVDYAYNGDGNRISQDALKYLLDLQPGLAVVLGDSDGNRYVYSPRGIHAVNDGSAWTYPVTDALGSVRGYADVANTVLSNVNYGEYGVPDTSIIGPAFTGEWRDETEVQYHRKRYLNPGLGVWLSLDPFEGMMNRPMSLNSYSWVEGNVLNTVDPTGMINENPDFWDMCGDHACEQLCDSIWGEANGMPEVSMQKAICLQDCYNRDNLLQLKQYANMLSSCLTFPTCNLLDRKPQPNHALSALKLLIEFGASQFPSPSIQTLTDDISTVLLGVKGTYTILEASAYQNRRHKLATLSTGFDLTYFQPEGQIAHFWAYLNTFTQGGYLVGLQADVQHECRGVNGLTDIFNPTGKGSIQDARVTTAALNIYNNVHDAQRLGEEVFNILSTSFDGWLAPWYYNGVACIDIAKEEYRARTGMELDNSFFSFYESPL